MRKKVIIAIIGILVITLGVTIIIAALNPLRKSEAEIREGILELTPIGMNMEVAIEILEAVRKDEKWLKFHVRDRVGVIMGELGLPGSHIGVQSIRATIGKYTTFRNILPFRTDVEVFWAFDENSELIEVFVSKCVSGL